MSNEMTEVMDALISLMKQFPTDRDMEEAGWDHDSVEAACDAYDKARAVVRKYSRGQS